VSFRFRWPRLNVFVSLNVAFLVAIVAFLESASDDELIRSIAPDVMACLSRSRFFEKLDDLLSPKDDLPLHHACDGTYKLSESILLSSGFDRADLGDIFRVFASMVGVVTARFFTTWRKSAV
jgi:hypothetical protein